MTKDTEVKPEESDQKDDEKVLVDAENIRTQTNQQKVNLKVFKCTSYILCLASPYRYCPKPPYHSLGSNFHLTDWKQRFWDLSYKYFYGHK